MDDSLKQEVLKTYSAYVQAFRENNVQALDKLNQYRSLTSAMAALPWLMPTRSSRPI